MQLAPAWISRDMNQAEPPLVANGMIFAYGSGENTAQAFPDVGLDFRMERRIPLSTHAVLVRARCAHGRGTLVERRSDHQPGITGAGSLSPTATSTSTPTTAIFTVSA